MDHTDPLSRIEAKTNADTLQQSSAATSRIVNRLKDAVYREMYRLEAQQPGSEMGLALALLRVIVVSHQLIDRGDSDDWLKEISPIALKLIEDGLDCCTECPQSPR